MTIPVARLKNDDGWTVVSTMAGIFVAAVVVGALSLFWMNSNKTANRVNDVSQQETAALRVLNAAAKDIKAANPIVAADSQSIVMERNENGVTVRTRYTLDKSDADNVKLMQHINPNATDTYSGSSSWPREKVLAERAQYAGAETLFDYYDARGNQIAAPVSAGNLPKVGRVDINFRADAGKGYVELSTKVAVKKSTGMAAGGPALCDIHDFTLALESGGVQVEFRGSNAGGINRYEIFRNNVAIGTVSHTGGNAVHTYVDMNANAGETNTYRVESITTGGVRNTACAARNIFVNALPAPEIGGSLVDSNESVRLYWTTVDGANRYRIDFSPVDGSVAPATITFNAPAVGGSSTNGLWTFRNVGGTIEAVWSGSDGELYRYTVTALAPSGATSLASNEIRLLTVATVRSITAIPQDYSVNRVQVSKRANEVLHLSNRRSEDDWWNVQTFPKQPNLSGVNQNATNVVHDDVLAAGGANTTDQSYLGYWYRYAATVSNNGPRSATPGQTYTSQTNQVLTGPAREASVLQYPADPEFVAEGTERANTGATLGGFRENTGAADGSNLIKVTSGSLRANYNRVLIRSFGTSTATSPVETITVQKSDSSAWSALTGSGRADSGELPGSRKFYAVVAENATGVSPSGAVARDRKAAYQRPAAVNFQDSGVWGANMNPKATVAITGPNGEPEGNKLTFRWSNVNTSTAQPWQPHQNDPAVASPSGTSGFCVSDKANANCAFQVVRKANGASSWSLRSSVTPDSGANWTNRQLVDYASGWNAKDTYGVRACNAGGCSTPQTEDVETYPGPFTMGDTEFQNMTARGWANNINYHADDPFCQLPGTNSKRCYWATPYQWDADAVYPGSKVKWTEPQGGAGSYEVKRQRKETSGWNLNVVSQSYPGDSTETKFWYTDPSMEFRYTVTAVSSHNPSLKRDASGGNIIMEAGDKSYQHIQMPPPLPSNTVNFQRCYVTGVNTVNNERWGSALILGTTAPSTVANGWQFIYPFDEFRVYKFDTRYDFDDGAGDLLPTSWYDPATERTYKRGEAVNNSNNNNYSGWHTASGFGLAMARHYGVGDPASATLFATLKSKHTNGFLIETQPGDNTLSTYKRSPSNSTDFTTADYTGAASNGNAKFVSNKIQNKPGAYLRWEVEAYRALQAPGIVAATRSEPYGNTDHRLADEGRISPSCWNADGPGYHDTATGGTHQRVSAATNYPDPDDPFDVGAWAKRNTVLTDDDVVHGTANNHWSQPRYRK